MASDQGLFRKLLDDVWKQNRNVGGFSLFITRLIDFLVILKRKNKLIEHIGTEEKSRLLSFKGATQIFEKCKMQIIPSLANPGSFCVESMQTVEELDFHMDDFLDLEIEMERHSSSNSNSNSNQHSSNIGVSSAFMLDAASANEDDDDDVSVHSLKYAGDKGAPVLPPKKIDQPTRGQNKEWKIVREMTKDAFQFYVGCCGCVHRYESRCSTTF